MTVGEVIGLLEGEYGCPRWRPRTEPLSELIGTVLSQNTSDINSRRAFDGLVATFGGWEAVARADAGQIAEAIRGGGLGEIKARRIKALLTIVLEERGSLDMGFLERLSTSEARAWLEALPGVGPKTAACVLLFSLGRPVLPVDTHVYRVSARLGLIDGRASPGRAQAMLEEMVAPQARYSFHVNVIAHGRTVCRARRPLCKDCVLAQGCPSASLGSPA